MTPVIQTILSAPGGNCFSACLASLFEVPLSEVPNFCYETPDGEDWVAAASKWTRDRFGFCLCVLRTAEGDDDGYQVMKTMFRRSGAYVICGVNTTRKSLHAVIFQNGNVVHDPWPGGSEIVGRIVDWTLLYPVDPLKIPCPT